MSWEKLDDGYIFVASVSGNKHGINNMKMHMTKGFEASVCISVFHIELYEGYVDWYECAISLKRTNLIVTTPFRNVLHLRIFNIAPLVNSTHRQNKVTHLHTSSKVLLKDLEKIHKAFWVMDYDIFSLDILGVEDRYMLMNIEERTKNKGSEFLILIPLYDNGRVIKIDDNKLYWWTETAAFNRQYLTSILMDLTMSSVGKCLLIDFIASGSSA